MVTLSIIYDRSACAIADHENDEVIITGGRNSEIDRRVSVYNEAGWQRDLPSLNQAREKHGCGSYVNRGKKVNNPT